MNVKLFTTYEQLSGHQADWDGLTNAYPFYQWAWVSNWLENLAGESTPFVLVAIDENDNWIGIAPFCIEPQFIGSSKTIRFIGSGKACGDYLNLICDDKNYEAFSQALVTWFGQQKNDLLSDVGMIELEGINPEDPRTKHFQLLMNEAGFRDHATELEGCWAVELSDSWDEMHRQFSKSLRRKTKKVVKSLTHESTTVLSSNDTDFQELWSSFVDLHQRRRQMLDQPGCFACPNFENFLCRTVQDMIKTGHAELVQINRDGVPFASMLLFNDGETVYMYQSGFEPDMMNELPGYHMVVLALQRSITSGFKTFDFLRGDEPYKARWLTKRVPLARIKFVSPRILPQLKHQVWLSGKSLHGFVSQILG